MTFIHFTPPQQCPRSASMTRLNGTTCPEQSKQQQMGGMVGGWRGRGGQGERSLQGRSLNELFVAGAGSCRRPIALQTDRAACLSLLGDTDTQRRVTSLRTRFFELLSVYASERPDVSPRTKRKMRSYDWPSRRRCLLWIYSLSPSPSLVCLPEKVSRLHNFDVFQLEPGKCPGASFVSVALRSTKLLTLLTLVTS